MDERGSEAMNVGEIDTDIHPDCYDRLRKAVENGDDDTLQSLLQTFTKEESRCILNHCSLTAAEPLLLVAIRHRHEDLVRLLVEHYGVDVGVGNDIQDQTMEGNQEKAVSPILQSISVGSPVILNMLCKEITDINTWYPVHFVCEEKSPNARETLPVLLRNGADVNLRDEEGLTPLLLACKRKNNDVIQILVQHGADVTLCSSDGDTALHHLITQEEVDASGALSLSTQEAILQISEVLLKHDMLQKPNDRGIAPLRLACLEGNESMVEFLLDNISLTDRQRAESYELLASSILFGDGFTYDYEKCLKNAHHFFHKAMQIRHSHTPPLWKIRKDDAVEAFLCKIESQTVDELDAIKTNLDDSLIEALLTRQRLVEVKFYNDLFLPIVCRYMIRQLEMGGVNQPLDIMMYVFKIQRSIPTCTKELQDRIELLDSICCKAQFDGTFDISVLVAVLNVIDEFYKCHNSDGIYLAKAAYVRLVDSLCSIFTNAHTRNDEDSAELLTLTQRFLHLTKESKNYICQPSSSALRSGPCSCDLKIPGHFIRNLVSGDNVLHIACREVPASYYDQKIAKVPKARRGLAELLQTLHLCGENVDEQNIDGKTPLQVLLCDTRDIREFYLERSLENFDLTEAVRRLLLARANPNIRDRSGGTSLHAAMIGYAYFFQCVPDYECGRNSDVNMQEWNEIVNILLRSGADPNVKDNRGFSPLHKLMDHIFCEDAGYYGAAVSNLGDRFAYRRQLLHEVVHTIQSFGGCAHATTKKGRTAFDMCKDNALLENMRQNITVTYAHLNLSCLAAAAIRKHEIRYQDKLPTRLVRIVEFND